MVLTDREIRIREVGDQTQTDEELETPSLEGFQTKIAPDTFNHSDILTKVANRFQLVQAHYGTRNSAVDSRRAFFKGNHWVEPADETEEGEFRLVINYCRRVVLDFAGMLSRAPTPRVPVPAAEEDTPDTQAARKREQLLRLVWPDFLTSWRRVELNAAKCAYGVLECVWREDLAVEEVSIRPQTGPSAPTGDPVAAADVPPSELGEEAPSQELTPSPPKKVKRYTESPFLFRSIKPEDFFPIYRTFDRSDDFLYIFRWDPRRLKTDIELQYGVLLGGSGTTTGSAGASATGAISSYVTGVEQTVDLIEYWDDLYYILIAKTVMEVPAKDSLRGGILARFRATQKPEQVPNYTVLAAKKHEYGRIPFWVVQNLEDTDQNPTDGGSISDIEDIEVLNQHLNLMRSEQAEEIVTNIHRPIVYKSPDHSQDPSTLSFTAGAVYPIGEDEELKPMDYTPLGEVVERHISEVERTIRTLSFLGDAGFGDFAAGTSGVAARIALTPMQRILELKLPPRTYVLESLSAFILRCFEKKIPEDAKLRGWIKIGVSRFESVEVGALDIAGQYYASVDYGNLLPKDDEAHQQNEVYKYGANIQSLFTTRENLGDPDPEMELKRMKKEAKDPWLNPERWLAVQQAIAQEKEMNAPQEPELAPTAPTPTAPPGEEIGQAGPGAGLASLLAGAGAGAGAGGLGTAPQVPGNQFSRAPNAGGFGAGRATPFLPRGKNPQLQAGPGINTGGLG